MRDAIRPLPLRSIVLAGLVAAAWLTAAPNASAAPLVVNSTADTTDGMCNLSPNCTLREAILVANATAAKDNITFNIGSGTPSIEVGLSGGGALPAITHPVSIDGSSGGATRVELVGDAAGSDADGLTVSGGTSTISDLVIDGFDGTGIRIDTAGGNVVTGCRIGTNATGTAASANSLHGILINGTGGGGVGGNTIGGTTAAARNVISGNGLVGVFIIGSNGNVVQGNYIGTNAVGTAALGNSADGIQINGAKSNVIGGTAAGARNVVSGNHHHGVEIVDIFSGTTTSGNLVQGNFIGTNAAGTAAVGNTNDGVHMEGIPLYNTIGGTTPAARNVISGNGDDGVKLAMFAFDHHDTVSGNYIGTDVTGTVAIGNGDAGVHIDAARKNTIGGTVPGAGNLISGNHGDGIRIDNTFGEPEQARGNVIRGNRIGTNAAGTAELGNSIGIHILGQPDNVIGGTTVASRNLVSGNAIGIDLAPGTSGTLVQGNFIGTDATGQNPVPNESDGIAVESSFNEIGGTLKGAGNVIAFNGPSIVGGNGVTVKTANAVPIQGNAIFSNSLLGIDLDDNGITANDALDADVGTNELQNFPTLTLAHSNATTTHVTGKVASEPNTSFTVEVFSSAQCDPSGHGEGGRFLGRTTVTSGGAGNGTFNVVFHTPTPVGDRITATATTTGNSTSEFSACRKVVQGS